MTMHPSFAGFGRSISTLIAGALALTLAAAVAPAHEMPDASDGVAATSRSSPSLCGRSQRSAFAIPI